MPMPGDPRALRAAQMLLAENGAVAARSVARAVGASVRTLERVFHSETALTLGRWRRRARLAAAIQMLADGADVTTVATSVGH